MKKTLKKDAREPRLSLEQITTLSDYCLQNASELVSEAKLLFENEKYARSLFLSILALEETSKRDVLWEAIFLGDDEKKWKSFWNRFRDHNTKLARMLKDYITIRSNREENTSFGILDEYLTKMKKAEEDAKEVNLVKLSAMYVGIVDGRISTPSQVITRKGASEILKLAQQHLEVHRSFKPTAQEVESRLSLKSKMKSGEDFIDYWYRIHSSNAQRK